MSFDFGGSLDEAPTDVGSETNIDPESPDYGSEQITESPDVPGDQVANQAENADFVDKTNPGSITDAPASVSGNEFVGPPAPSSIDQAISGAKDSLASAADKAKDAASGAFDKIKAGAESTLTKLEDQFSAKNIEAFATKTAKSLITQVENTAINYAKGVATQALSTVVGPAAAATLTNGVTRSLTGPTTKTAGSVSSTTNPQATTPASYTTDSAGNTYQVDANGNKTLYRAAEAPEDVSADTAGLVTSSPADVPANQVDNSASNVGYVTGRDPENGTYYVKNEKTGVIVASGLTEQQATLKAQDQTFVDAGDIPASANTGNSAVNYNAASTVNDPTLATQPANPGAASISNNNPVSATDAGLVGPPTSLANAGSIAAAAAANAALVAAGSSTRALLTQAQQQQTARQQYQNQAQSGDWRVRLSLAPSSNYLYNDPNCGPVLWPLYLTNGVIFPYTPSIDTSYKANYSAYDLTHSNYRGYFYQNSYVDGINIKATFTAQDTAEANYLLAVIHFFRSVTKMFYGQDAERGTPPPLVFLSGLGDYQFNQHPCVVSQFNYNLPADVNYIRAQSVANNGTNQLAARARQVTLGNPVSNAIQRLASLGQGINPGALTAPFSAGNLAAGNPTYVPTKMDISLILLPMQSRSQVSQQFSLKAFANGNLLKGGFW